MDQKCDSLYPSEPFENKNIVNSFNNSINSIKEMITYFKDKNNKSKKRYKNIKQ